MSSEIKNFFSGLYEKIEQPAISYIVGYFRETPSGEVVERKMTTAIISDYLKNPIVLILLMIGIFLIIKGLRGR